MSGQLKVIKKAKKILERKKKKGDIKKNVTDEKDKTVALLQ